MDFNQEYFINYLESLKDEKTRLFNTKIIKTKYEMLGIKIPVLRKIAPKIEDYQKFLDMPNKYYEIVMLKLLVIAKIKDKEKLVSYLNKHLKLIDNWAFTDTLAVSLKIIKHNKAYFYQYIDKLIKSKKEYDIRLGLVLWLDYYVEKEYLSDIFKKIVEIDYDSYYVKMAKAWLLCECFIKYEEETLAFLKKGQLDKFTLNKTIAKINDSYRVKKEKKLDLKKGFIN